MATMKAGQNTEAQMLKALDKASATIARRQTRSAAKELEIPDLAEMCKTYKSSKPLIELALPLIEKIPVYGKKITDVLRFLMKFADVACA